MADTLSQSLGTDLGSPPVGFSKIKNPEKPDEYYEISGRGVSAESEIPLLTARGKEASERALTQGKIKATEGYKEALQNNPISTQLDKIIDERNKKFIPTQETAGDISNLFTATSLIGFMLGGLGKNHAQQALSGMNGMLEGHIKGEQDRYKKEKDLYEENSKALDKLVTTLQEKKKEVMELAKTDYEGALLEAEKDAHEKGYPFLAEMARKTGVIGYGKYADSIIKKLEDKRKFDANLVERSEARKSREQMAKDNYALRAQIEINREEDKKEKHAEKYGGASGLVAAFTGVQMPDKQAKEVTGIANAMGEAESLKNYVSQNPDVVGRKGQIEAAYEKYISSLLTGEQYNPVDHQEQKALVFAKRYAAYLVSYERNLAGGAKGFTVALQKRFNDLLKPGQFNPDGFVNLMNEHMVSLAKGGASVDQRIDANNLMSMGRDIVGRAEMPITPAQTTTPAASGTASSKPMPTGEKLKSYAKEHFEGNEQEAIKYLRSQGYQ
jgi:hypothetical protein